MVRIIPDQRLPFQGAGAHAERKMLEYLKVLPDDYYVLRECKLTPTSSRRSQGSQEDRSDFLLIGPQLGIMIFEVKDWNIRTNTFQFLNQYEVCKTDIATSTSTLLENPWSQANKYLYAIRELLEKQAAPQKLWVSSFVAYPKLYRAEFENTFVGADPRNPQAHFSIDLSRTLFINDLRPTQVQPLLDYLTQHVQRSLHTTRRSIHILYSQEQVEAAVEWLIPSEMRVGGLPDHKDAVRKFALLDAKQQEWAFGSALNQKKYLSDVAGSGKTNVLLSRAIYWAKQHLDTGGCRILITTYSRALQVELQRMFKAKIAHDPYYDYYTASITIIDVISLMENIVRRARQETFEQWKTQSIATYTEAIYIEEQLPEACIDILQTDTWHFEPYDYLLIDEIQDFSTWFLEVSLMLLKDRDHLFTVGDIGQKLFNRDLEWSSFDIIKQRVALESRFLMYRSPQPVARLAWRFLIADPFLLNDLQEEGYHTEEMKPKSPFQTRPIFLSYETEEALLKEATTHLLEYLYSVRPEQILCIGLKDGGLLQALYNSLQQSSVPVRWASDAATINGQYIVLADYLEAKGLEREYVFVIDADRLAINKDIFASTEQRRQIMIRDRIKLFVALTRAVRAVRLYFIDQQHIFIRDLLRLQSEEKR